MPALVEVDTNTHCRVSKHFVHSVVGSEASGASLMTRITAPYLLCVEVPIVIDQEGHRWTNELWIKDLALHLDYLDNVTLACPCFRGVPAATDQRVDVPPFDRLKFIDLPHPKTHFEALCCLPRYVGSLWRATKYASIIHAGFGGWPYATGWFVVPFGKLQKKFVITNVESSFWRTKGQTVRPWKRIAALFSERLARRAIKIADVRLFTSQSYAAQFLPADAPRVFVVPATWVNEEWILTDDHARASWDDKHGRVRLLFAGRLIAEKGVCVLWKAIDRVAASGVELEVTFIGDGPIRDECVRDAAAGRGSVSVRFLDPVPYGESFLSILRRHDAVVIPSISEEQPRLVFDAFSQAVPVIGSSTGGIGEIVEAGTTGRLVSPGDIAALAEALVWASNSRPGLRAMGMAALARVRGRTHQAMHRRRHEILLQTLPLMQKRALEIAHG